MNAQAHTTIPSHVEVALHNYYQHGIKPKSWFVRACIDNKLNHAVKKATQEEFLALPAIVAYIERQVKL